jgi:hypothetical protein
MTWVYSLLQGEDIDFCEKSFKSKGFKMFKKLTFVTCLYIPVLAGNGAHAQNIHTVLPIDAIPAVFSPKFLPAGEAEVLKDSPMIGVSIAGEHHAYSMVLLNAHEIVNDVVGGKAIATTW